MKNIEKYTNTKDALAAYNALGLNKVPFDTWLECEFEEPREQTLLEAASEVRRTWESQWQYGHLSIIEKAVRKLSIAIEREKRKPVRNCDAFSKDEVLEMLKDRSFSKEDTIEWLYEEAKGETK